MRTQFVLSALALLTGCAGLQGARIELRGFGPEFTHRVTGAVHDFHRKQCTEGVLGEHREARAEVREPHVHPHYRPLYPERDLVRVEANAAAQVECR
jgi:hypothetical protein